MMSDMLTMPDTTKHWKAQIHRLAYEKGSITLRDAKDLAKTIEDCPLNNVAGFLQRRRWFRKSSKGFYEPINIWHDTRFNPTLTRKHRKDDIEYSIVSLLQNAGSLTGNEIRQGIWLNSGREIVLNQVTLCCNNSKHIFGSKDMGWQVKLK